LPSWKGKVTKEIINHICGQLNDETTRQVGTI
jgi:hypothetical protein